MAPWCRTLGDAAYRFLRAVRWARAALKWNGATG